jgi:EAL domain-containing protein (putative c-di-GMP-specific phosphodiesterase class I)
MQDVTSASSTLRDAKSLGVSLALDDFGAGYSSLSYLRQFPLDQLKLDRAFVAALGSDGPEQAIVGAIVNMARALNIAVIAEGIEDETQHSVLLGLGCELGQGYLFARPCLPDVLEKVLRDAGDAEGATPPVSGELPGEIASATG